MFNINEFFQTKVKPNVRKYISNDPLKLKNGDVLLVDEEGTSDNKNSRHISYVISVMKLNDDDNICYMYRSWKEFYDVIFSVIKKGWKITLIAHNGSGYDWKIGIGQLVEHYGFQLYNPEEKLIRLADGTYKNDGENKAGDMTKKIRTFYKDGKIYQANICLSDEIVTNKKGKKNRKSTSIILRDSMLIMAGSLEQLCQDCLSLYLPKNNLDYSVYRDSNTDLTNEEILYCYGDVYGLKYLVNNVINKEHHFSLELCNRQKAFIFDDTYKKYEFTNKYGRFLDYNGCIINIKDLKVKLYDKLTSSSYALYICKWFIHYDLVRCAIYLLDNPSIKRTKFQQFICDKFTDECNKIKTKNNRVDKKKEEKFSYENSFRIIFPKLDKFIDDVNKIDTTLWLKKSYQGGRVFNGRNFHNYYYEGKYNHKIRRNGMTIDANSLYPSQMYYKHMPYGLPTVVTPKNFERNKKYYLNDKTSFIEFYIDGKVELKKNKFPMLRVTNNMCYGSVASDSFINNIRIKNGQTQYETLSLCLNSVDFKNFTDSYDHTKMKITKVLSFDNVIGIFENFVHYFYEIKKNSKGLEKYNAKLILNSCYGKFGTKPVNDKIIFTVDENGIVGNSKTYMQNYGSTDSHLTNKCNLNKELKFEEIKERQEPVYMPVASVITAEGRHELKKYAELIEMDKFLYCDTDSLHVLATKEYLLSKGLQLDDKELGYWAIEGYFTEGIYLGSKRYAEKVGTDKDGKITTNIDNIVNYKWVIKCCGITQKTQQKIAETPELFDYSRYTPSEFKKLLDKNLIEPKDYYYVDSKTKDPITGSFIVLKSYACKDGINFKNMPYLITRNFLYLFGSDIG